MKRRPTRTKLGKGLYLNRNSEGHFTSWTKRGSNTTINSGPKGTRYTLKSGKLFKQLYAPVKAKRPPKLKFPKGSISRKHKPLRAVAEKPRRYRRSTRSASGGDGILFPLILLFLAISVAATLISYAIGVMLVGWLVAELFDDRSPLRWLCRISCPSLILISVGLYQLQPAWLLELDRMQRSLMWFEWKDAPAGLYAATGLPSLVIVVALLLMWLAGYEEEEDDEVS